MGMPPADGLPPAGPEGGMGGKAATEMVTEEKIKELGEKAQELSDEIQALVQDVNAEEAEGEEVPGGVLETEGEELEEIGEGLEGEAEVVEGEGESLEGEGDEQALDLDQIFNEGPWARSSQPWRTSPTTAVPSSLPPPLPWTWKPLWMTTACRNLAMS